MSPALRKYFDDYFQYHRTRGNQITHAFGIPILMVSVFGLLAGIGHFGTFGSGILQLDLGIALWGVAVIWYFRLDYKIALPFSIFALGCYFLGRTFPSTVLWVLFVLGWIFQGIGHAVYEKKSPAFFKNLEHLIIAPILIFAKWVRYT